MLPTVRSRGPDRAGYRLDAAPLLGPAPADSARALRGRAALRGAARLGDHGAGARRHRALRRGVSLRREHRGRRPLPGRRRDRSGGARRRPFDAREQPPPPDENIAGGVPYPDAVETVREWHDAGHWIHVTSHRRRSTYDATAAWLDSIGMPWGDPHCSFDKVPRCVELGIHVLVDDSPVNIAKARSEGILPATILHPWNEE